MPKRTPALTALEVKNFYFIEGVHTVGGVKGLCLRIRKRIDGSYSRTWVLRCQGAHTSYKATLGEVTTMTLGEAREKAQEIKKRAENPVEERKKAIERQRAKAQALVRQKTLNEVARQTFEELTISGAWKDKETVSREQQRLSTYVLTAVGDRQIQELTARDLIAVFESEKMRSLSLSSVYRIKGNLSKVFDYATRKGILEENPLDSGKFRALMKTLPKNRKEEKHMPALVPAEIPIFIREVVSYIIQCAKRGDPVVVATCFLFSILTSSRSANARGALWKEFDLTGGVWTIPAKKMKVSRNGNHRVFLATQVLALLEALPVISGSSFVFPSYHLGGFRGKVFYSFIQRINEERKKNGCEPFVDTRQKDANGEYSPISQHGTARASYKTWTLTAKNSRGEFLNTNAVELSLHHKPQTAGSLGGAYEREEFLNERREIAQLWADYCFSATTAETFKAFLEVLGGIHGDKIPIPP